MPGEHYWLLDRQTLILRYPQEASAWALTLTAHCVCRGETLACLLLAAQHFNWMRHMFRFARLTHGALCKEPIVLLVTHAASSKHPQRHFPCQLTLWARCCNCCLLELRTARPWPLGKIQAGWARSKRRGPRVGVLSAPAHTWQDAPHGCLSIIQ